MKVYSKAQVDAAISAAIRKLFNDIHDDCLRHVAQHMNEIVLSRENADLIKLEERVSTLEIDNIVHLVHMPKKSNNKHSRQVKDKISNRLKSSNGSSIKIS